ncbi:MAG TPA: sigma-54 dependent transcriptional regulator [Myxococcota bacterium]|nr:sigma-54 dependent transcriptional regulator [Myxococcota bacterium]
MAIVPMRADGAPGREAPGSLLLIDDEPLLLRSLRRALEGEGYRTSIAESVAAARSRIAESEPDVVLLDLGLGRDSGLALLEHLKREHPEVEVIMMTGNASIESAVGCIRGGAFDYLAKPFDEHRVRTTVRRAIERRRLVRRNRELEEELRGRGAGSDLIGRSPRMRALARTIASLGHNESHVLIRGESGTGKELVARALHAASPRAQRRFVPVDCGALPASIIESELFGHAKGAFTGATGAAGLFRVADGGTLFLDEIGELSPAVQGKLLRAIQEKEVRPLGSAESVPVDLRIIAATHRDLEAMIADGMFRTDLFYRIDVVRIEIPPLRERREDVPQLVQHFIAKHARRERPIEGIEDDALELLRAHDWPGNVRELENAIESALAIAPGPRLSAADLPRERRTAAVGVAAPVQIPLSLARYECAALERALAEADGDAREAARRLGIGRSTLYRKLGRHGLRARR